MGSGEPSRGAASGERHSGIDRRRALEIITSGAAATALAGCSDETSEASDGGSSGSGDAVTNATGTDERESFDIGLLSPMGTLMGRSATRCARIAVNERNEVGGVRDREAVLHVRDTELDPDTASDRAAELLSDPGVDLLVGTFDDAASRAVVEQVGEVNVPFLVTGSADPSLLTETVGRAAETYRNVFRIGPLNRAVQTGVVADYADFLRSTAGFDEFAVLFETETWSRTVTEALPIQFRERGLEIVAEYGFPADTTDFTPFLDDLEESVADAVFRFTTHADDARLVDAWRTREYPFALEGVSVPASVHDYWARTDGSCRYTTTGRTGRCDLGTTDGRSRSLVETYDSRYGSERPPEKPTVMGFVTYDAIHYYAHAVAVAGTADHERALETIVDALLSETFEGTTGEISLSDTRYPYPHELQSVSDETGAITNFRLLQWRDGGDDGGALECVFPRRYATANYTVPHWL